MKNCPYCGSTGDYYFNIYTRIYYRCRECDLIYKSIQEDYHQVLATYSRDDYFSRYFCDQTDGRRDKLFNCILDFLEERKNIKSLLDVGTGCGFFMLAARKRGWSAKGIEPSTGSTQFACKQNNLDVFNGTLQEYPENDRFDIITFINVIDHSAEPWKEIEKANNLLKPGGVLYLRFPNGLLHTRIYQLATKFGLAKRISKFLVFHQFPFTTKFIYKLLADSGFSEITILNSPHSEGDPHNLFPDPTFAQYVKRSLYLMAKAIQNLTQGKVLLGTSLEVLATKPKIT